MGYVVTSPIIKLVFKEVEEQQLGEGEPLIVKMKSLSILEYDRVFNPFAREWLDDLAFDSDNPEESLAKLVEKAKQLNPLDDQYEKFAKHLVDWNVEAPVMKDGEPTGEVRPVPKTVAGLKSLDMLFVRMLYTAWRNALVGVDNPLLRTSGAGRSSQTTENVERSIPTETLSENQKN